VVAERVHDGLPLAFELDIPLGQGLGGLGFPFEQGARHVLPDQEPQLVAPVVEPVGLDLDVLAEHVHAQGFDGLEIGPEGGVGRRGVQAVRPPALVERPDLEERFAVEKETVEALPVLAQGDLAHPGIARHGVDRTSFLLQRDLEVVEHGIVRGPELGPVDRDGERLRSGALGRGDRRPL